MEPIVFKDHQRFADEAVYEEESNGVGIGISDKDRMRILVEVKSRKSFPDSFEYLGRFDRAFSQLIQEAALALVSCKWNTELLIAMATVDFWYLFQLIDESESDDDCVRLAINDSWFHGVYMPYFDSKDYSLANVQQIASHQLLISFLTAYLCSPSKL